MSYLTPQGDIENWGINTKKMKGGTGGDMSGIGAVSVYIFYN